MTVCAGTDDEMISSVIFLVDISRMQKRGFNNGNM